MTEIVEVTAAPVVAVPDRLQHQPALDGLRGVAVIAVLIWHDALTHDPNGWLRGGFLGVDLFFVLSGFLITSLLLLEHRRTGRYVSVQFWIRRARRLLPAVFVLLLIVCAYAVFVASPFDLRDLRSEGLATLFYVQNWYVIGVHDLSASALGHTWSLSIEEQFYLIWPVALLALSRVCSHDKRRLVASLSALACLAALLMSALYVHGNHGRVFYGTDTRSQGLFVGAALAVLVSGGSELRQRSTRIRIEILGVVGAVALALLLTHVTTDTDWLYHGGFLLTSIASACVIAAAVQPAGAVRRALSWRPLRAVGLISYGLYLYHWPIYLWLERPRVALSGYPLFALRLAVTFIVATASYHFVERPIRRGEIAPRKLAVGLPVAATVMVALIVVSTLGARNASASDIAALAYRQQAANVPPGSVKVLVAGDIDVFNLWANGGGLYQHDRIVGATAASLDCGIATGRVLIGTVLQPVRHCAQWVTSYRTAIDNFNPAVVVLMIGQTSIFDRNIAGHALRAETAPLAAYLDAQLEQARQVLTARGARG